MGKNKRSKKRTSKKPLEKDQVASEQGPSLADVKLEKSEFSFGQKLNAAPSDAGASACPMDTASIPADVAGAAGSAVTEGFSFSSLPTSTTDKGKNSEIVGASSSSSAGGGSGAAENLTAFKPVVSSNVASQKQVKVPMVQVADKAKGKNGTAKGPGEKRGKRKFADVEEIAGTVNNQNYTNTSIVAEHLSTVTKKTTENTEKDLSRSTPPKAVEKKTNKPPAKTASQIESENKQRNKIVSEAEKREFERNMPFYNFCIMAEINFQQHLANQASVETKTKEEPNKKEQDKKNKKGNNEKIKDVPEIQQDTCVTTSKQDCSEGINTAVATGLRAECQKFSNVREAGAAETRYWEKDQNNSHGKRNTRSASKEKKVEFIKEVKKEVKKVESVKEQKESKKKAKKAKVITRKRATKSLSEDSGCKENEEPKRVRATSSMSDIQNDIDDAKLTYAGMVIKGEKDRMARFEENLAGYLVDEYKNVARLQTAIACEAVYQRSLVSKNDLNVNASKGKEEQNILENAKKSQRKRQKSRSKSKEIELPVEEIIKKEVVEEVKSARQTKRSPSQDQECQTDPKSRHDRCAEMVTLPMEEDFTKRLKEEMSQRASAETMVRMLETETTEQRHSLAEERGKIAKLEALVVHLESEVKEKTLIADEYKSRLEETEKQLREANERIIKLETSGATTGQYGSSTDYMFMSHGKDRTIEQTLKLRELQDEVQRYKDELEMAQMEVQPGMMSVLEHQDILQVVELRAQQAEIKALQLENEILKLKNTKEAWSAASPSHVTSSEPVSTNPTHGEFSLSAASLFSGLPGYDIQSGTGNNQSGVTTSTFQLPSFFTSPTGGGGASTYSITPSTELQFGSAFSAYDPATVGSVGGVRKSHGDVDSLSSESDWSISEDEAASNKPGKNKRGEKPAPLSDQENLPVGASAQKYSTRKKKPPLPPKPKPKVGPKPGAVKIPRSVQRLGVPLMAMNTNGVSAMHASTVQSEEAVSFDQRPQEAKLRVPKRAAGPRGRRRPKLPS